MTRRFWILADQHIGRVSDGRDGADYCRAAVEDIRNLATELGGFDYVINLGDMTASGKEAELRTYADIRSAAEIGPWYEVVGNHDFRTIAAGTYDRIVACPKYWSLKDGSLLFLSLPHERGNAAGLFLPEVDAWLRRSVASFGNCSVVICAHSFPYDTVDFSTRPARCLYPRNAVASFLNETRIDLWLGGHIHFAPRSSGCKVRKNVTWFVNVGSINHAYGTGASLSFVFEIEQGAAMLVGRCRNHDLKVFLPEHEVRIELSQPFEAACRPEFAGSNLNISPIYSTITEEQVEELPQVGGPPYEGGSLCSS